MPSPSPAANSYGTLAGVAGYARVYTLAGAFGTTTNPTDTIVVAWIDQLSASLNAALGAYGFNVPITQADAKLACTMVIEQLAGDLAQAANSAGRFFTDKALQSGVSPWVAVQKNINQWVQQYASGLEQLGAARNVVANETKIGFRGSDAVGDAVAPIFQRKAFGNKFQDWDSDENQGAWPDTLQPPNG